MHTPTELILALKEIGSSTVFVETGTYLGDTAAWAALFFDQVFSIELSGDHYAHARKRFSSQASIMLRQGRSELILNEIVADLRCSAIFWLDAHWSGPGTDGESNECPVIDEIAVIEAASCNHFILIDDANYFFKPPPPPHKPDHWPLLPDIFDALRAKSPRNGIFLVGNVIVKIPQAHVASVRRYLSDLSRQPAKSEAS
ncbi:MAG: hypothetical protein ACRCTD_13105 [Beijerinckiaceae bacterium]